MKILIIGGAEYSASTSEYSEVIAINDHHSDINTRFKCDGVNLLYGHTRNKPWIGLDQVGTCEQYQDRSPYYFEHHNQKIYPYEWANIFRKQYKMKPFTGMYCLEYIRQRTLESIHLDGMTFYHEKENGKFVKPKNMKRDSHDIEANIRYLLEVKRIDARVSFNDDLLEILELY